MTRSETVEDFERWVSPYLERMALIAARFAPSADREDVVQDALLRAWRHRDKFDSKKGTVGGWLFAITANVARTHARRPVLASILLSAEAEIRDHDQDLDLDAAIRRLSKRQKLAVECYYAVGLTVAETAQVMACSEGTVKSTLADARSSLKVVLDGKEGPNRGRA